MGDEFEAALRGGLARLGIPASDAQVKQLTKYAGLLQKWSKVYNLTALRSPGEILTHHLLDSLAATRPIIARLGPDELRVADIGSGAGLPGAVLAICSPAWRVDCVDAVGKKAAFVQQVAGAAALPNLRGVHARVEALEGAYRLVTSRAFASLPDFVRWTSHLLGRDGVWAAMKGKLPTDEIAELPAEVEVFHVEQLTIPGLDAERCLVWMRRRAAFT